MFLARTELDMIILEQIIRWLVFNVVLALLPILVNFFSLLMIKHGDGDDSKNYWREVVKEGELFIFSSTLSATSIGTVIFQASRSNTISATTFQSTSTNGLAITAIISSLIFVLLMSTALFGTSTFAKYVRQNSDSQVE